MKRVSSVLFFAVFFWAVSPCVSVQAQVVPITATNWPALHAFLKQLEARVLPAYNRLIGAGAGGEALGDPAREIIWKFDPSFTIDARIVRDQISEPQITFSQGFLELLFTPQIFGAGFAPSTGDHRLDQAQISKMIFITLHELAHQIELKRRQARQAAQAMDSQPVELRTDEIAYDLAHLARVYDWGSTYFFEDIARLRAPGRADEFASAFQSTHPHDLVRGGANELATSIAPLYLGDPSDEIVDDRGQIHLVSPSTLSVEQLRTEVLAHAPAYSATTWQTMLTDYAAAYTQANTRSQLRPQHLQELFAKWGQVRGYAARHGEHFTAPDYAAYFQTLEACARGYVTRVAEIGTGSVTHREDADQLAIATLLPSIAGSTTALPPSFSRQLATVIRRVPAAREALLFLASPTPLQAQEWVRNDVESVRANNLVIAAVARGDVLSRRFFKERLDRLVFEAAFDGGPQHFLPWLLWNTNAPRPLNEPTRLRDQKLLSYFYLAAPTNRLQSTAEIRAELLRHQGMLGFASLFSKTPIDWRGVFRDAGISEDAGMTQLNAAIRGFCASAQTESAVNAVIEYVNDMDSELRNRSQIGLEPATQAAVVQLIEAHSRRNPRRRNAATILRVARALRSVTHGTSLLEQRVAARRGLAGLAGQNLANAIRDLALPLAADGSDEEMAISAQERAAYAYALEHAGQILRGLRANAGFRLNQAGIPTVVNTLLNRLWIPHAGTPRAAGYTYASPVELLTEVFQSIVDGRPWIVPTEFREGNPSPFQQLLVTVNERVSTGMRQPEAPHIFRDVFLRLRGDGTQIVRFFVPSDAREIRSLIRFMSLICISSPTPQATQIRASIVRTLLAQLPTTSLADRIAAFEGLTAFKSSSAEADEYFRAAGLAQVERSQLRQWLQDRRLGDQSLIDETTYQVVSPPVRPNSSATTVYTAISEIMQLHFGSAMARNAVIERVARLGQVRGGTAALVRRSQDPAMSIHSASRERRAAQGLPFLSAFVELLGRLTPEQRWDWIARLRASRSFELRAEEAQVLARVNLVQSRIANETARPRTDDSDADNLPDPAELIRSIRNLTPEEKVPLILLVLSAGERPLRREPNYLERVDGMLGVSVGSVQARAAQAFLTIERAEVRTAANAYRLAMPSDRTSSLRNYFELFSGFGVKLAQTMSILHTDPEVRRELASAKDRAPGLSWVQIQEQVDRYNASPEGRLRRIARVIEIYNAASMKTVARIEMEDGTVWAAGFFRNNALAIYLYNGQLLLNFLAELRRIDINRGVALDQQIPLEQLESIARALMTQAPQELDPHFEVQRAQVADSVLPGLARQEGLELVVPHEEVLSGGGVQILLMTDIARPDQGITTATLPDPLITEADHLAGRRIVRVALRALFEHGFWNPDLHRGNIRQHSTLPTQYWFDFGQVTLFGVNAAGVRDQRLLAEFIQAVLIQDRDALARIGLEMRDAGRPPSAAARTRLATALAQVELQGGTHFFDDVTRIVTTFHVTQLPLGIRFEFGALKGLLTVMGEQYVPTADFLSELTQHLERELAGPRVTTPIPSGAPGAAPCVAEKVRRATPRRPR